MGHEIHSKVNPVHEWHGWFWIRLIHTFREADKLSSGLLGVPKQSVNEARARPLCISWSRWQMWKNYIRIQGIWGDHLLKKWIDSCHPFNHPKSVHKIMIGCNLTMQFSFTCCQMNMAAMWYWHLCISDTSMQNLRNVKFCKEKLPFVQHDWQILQLLHVYSILFWYRVILH